MRFSLRSSLGRLARAAVFPAALAVLALGVHTAHAQMPPGAKQPSEFPHVKLRAGMYVIDAAVAASDADR